MPELPDITVYLEALDVRITGRPLEAVRLKSPYLLRSVEPPLASVEGRTVVGFRRIGKRIVFELEGSMFMVLHLMIAGSLVQRIVYAGNEANYCAECQTRGRLLADRALSRLLKDDWPKTLEELEERRRS